MQCGVIVAKTAVSSELSLPTIPSPLDLQVLPKLMADASRCDGLGCIMKGQVFSNQLYRLGPWLPHVLAFL